MDKIIESKFKIDLFDDIEKEIESFFTKGVPVDVRKLNNRISEIHEYISSLEEKPENVLDNIRVIAAKSGLLLIDLNKKEIEKYKVLYKIIFKRDKTPLVISENLAISIMDNYYKANSQEDLIAAVDEDTSEILMISKSEISYIVFHTKIKIEEKD